MRIQLPKSCVLLFIFVLGLLPGTSAQVNTEGQHMAVILRSVGHQVLLDSGDSSSLVLPIEQEGEHYIIRFEHPFSFEPQQFSHTVDRVIRKNGLTSSYICQVFSCLEEQVVYSYEVEAASDLTPCGGRTFPAACYFITIHFASSSHVSGMDLPSNNNNSMLLVLLLIAFVALSVMSYLLVKKWKNKGIPVAVSGDRIYTFGMYELDVNGMKIKHPEEEIELTGKESDLLVVLLKSANTTVKREVILRQVWEDEGGYVGRTLDVFVSRLRKKLSKDPAIQIINVRGIGYKLTIRPTNQ